MAYTGNPGNYDKTIWKNNNVPSINETNLNKVENKVYEMDQNILNMISGKFNTTEANSLVRSVSVDDKTGIMRVYHYNSKQDIFYLYKLIPNAKYIKDLMEDQYNTYQAKYDDWWDKKRLWLDTWIEDWADSFRAHLDNAELAAEDAQKARDDAEMYRNEASELADEASNHADQAGDYASQASSDAESAAEYLKQCREYYNDVVKEVDKINGLVWAGSVAGVANLPATAPINTVYNITNEFTTTTAFEEGAGKVYGPGTDVLYGKNGKWNVLGGYGVSSIIARNGDIYRGDISWWVIRNLPFYRFNNNGAVDGGIWYNGMVSGLRIYTVEQLMDCLMGPIANDVGPSHFNAGRIQWNIPDTFITAGSWLRYFMMYQDHYHNGVYNPVGELFLLNASKDIYYVVLSGGINADVPARIDRYYKIDLEALSNGVAVPGIYDPTTDMTLSNKPAVQFCIDGSIRLKAKDTSTWNYGHGCAIYFGDGVNCYICETYDDDMTLSAGDMTLSANDDMTLSANDGYMTLSALWFSKNNPESQTDKTFLQFKGQDANGDVKYSKLTDSRLIITDVYNNKIATEINSSSICHARSGGGPGFVISLKSYDTLDNPTDLTATQQYGFRTNEFIPSKTASLGSSSLKWSGVYATNGTIQTSDRTKKTDITDLDPELTTKFIMGLKPSSYKMIEGTSGRTHYGMIAQDIEDLMDELGMSSLDFAGFIKSPREIWPDPHIEVEETDEYGITVKKRVDNPDKELKIIDGEYDYSLRYDEFVAPMIKMLQVHEKKIEALQEENASLKKAISDLFTLYNELAVKNGILVRELTEFEVNNQI